MFCKECGYEINRNELNCPVCGAKVLQVKNTKVDKLEEYGRRFLAGDMNAYNDIYMNTEKWLRSMLYHRINKEEVENCMQEIYLKLYRNISYFNPDKGSFRAWFNRVAENYANDYRDKVNNYAKHINDSYMVADEEGFSEM